MKQWMIACAALGASVVVGGGLLAQETTRPQSSSASLNAADRAFVMKAAKGGMMEVKLGDISQKQGTKDEVKQFGQKMVEDHSKANDELKQLAQQKSVTLPTDLDGKQTRMVMRLSKLNGARFDQAYISDMVKDHKEDVRDFAKEAKYGKDPDVKAWAARTLPTLQEHLKMVQDIQKTVVPKAKTAKK